MPIRPSEIGTEEPFRPGFPDPCASGFSPSFIDEVCNFHVPQLVDFDDGWLTIQMTVVTRPFLLAFGSADLDESSGFSQEALADWENELRDRFDSAFPPLERVLALLRLHAIYLTDIHRHDAAFR